MGTVDIYIQLLGDEKGTLRPAQAMPLENGLFKVLPIANYETIDEAWEFVPGSIVRCEKRNYRGEDYLLAVEKAG